MNIHFKISGFNFPKFIGVCFICVFHIQLLSQNKIIIYEMGRPNGLAYNNAKRIVGDQYQINFIYAGQDMIDSLGIEPLENKNVISRDKLKKKHGNEWMNAFYEKVNQELEIHESMRNYLINTDSYLKIKNHELSILFEKMFWCKIKYKVFVVGQYRIGDRYEMKTFLQLKMNSRSMKLKGIKEKIVPLTITYEENGIY